MNTMIAITIRSISLISLILLFIAGASAQDSSADDPDFIVPARPTVSNPAQFQKPGVLQLEFGFNSNFKAPGPSSEQDFPLALRFAVSRRVLLEFDGDSPLSQNNGGVRTTGVSDTQLGIQFVVQPEKQSRPGFAIAYYLKLPTASSTKGLGTGRSDHNFVLLLSKSVGKTTIDFNGSWFLAGRTSERGHASSAQAAFAVSHPITKRWAVQGELSCSGRNDEQPGSVFLLTAVTYQVNRRLVLDSGARAALNHDGLGVGIFTGVTVGVADLYRRHRHN
jgi:hypothetical protein